jgi:hypothetical protein
MISVKIKKKSLYPFCLIGSQIKIIREAFGLLTLEISKQKNTQETRRGILVAMVRRKLCDTDKK